MGHASESVPPPSDSSKEVIQNALHDRWAPGHLVGSGTDVDINDSAGGSGSGGDGKLEMQLNKATDTAKDSDSAYERKS